MERFEGLTALVTGAAGGIGSAIVRRFMAEGISGVGLVGHQVEPLKDLAQELDPQGDRTWARALDLTEEGCVVPLMHDFVQRFGKIDILINNAGITRDNLSIRMTPEAWDDVIHLNLTQVFHLTNEALKVMLRQKTGAIVNISSVVGVMGNKGQANYAASKAGVLALTKTWAMEYISKNVRVNAVAPGYIDTPMTAAMPSEVREALVKYIPMQRMGRPEEVAAAVAFLASPEASYVTGITLSVSGGVCMMA